MLCYVLICYVLFCAYLLCFVMFYLVYLFVLFGVFLHSRVNSLGQPQDLTQNPHPKVKRGRCSALDGSMPTFATSSGILQHGFINESKFSPKSLDKTRMIISEVVHSCS